MMETYLFLDEVLHYNCGRGHEGRITKASKLTEVKHEILLLRVAVMARLICIPFGTGWREGKHEILLSDLTEVKHEILLSRTAVMAGLIYIYLSKLGNEVSRVHVTSWLLSQYLTSLVYLATCDLTCVYGHSWPHLCIWPLATSLVYMAIQLSSYTDLFVSPDDPLNWIPQPVFMWRDRLSCVLSIGRKCT